MPAITHTRLAHYDRADAGLDLALRQIAVANNPPPARLVHQIRMRVDECRYLDLNRVG